MVDIARVKKPVAYSLAPSPLELQHEVEQFLFYEGALLDEGQFREWVDLLAEDVSYVMLTNTSAQTRDRRKGVHPPLTYIFNETKYTLERRVASVETGMAWAEEPMSRSRRFVSNVRILSHSNDEVELGCNFIIHRAARGTEHHTWYGTRRDKLRRVSNGVGWQLVRRELELDEFVLRSANISILF
jgi:3-phenylpropionate/trans-cinnamate dioxygenase beta subunit